jgi:hypothetical protein
MTPSTLKRLSPFLVGAIALVGCAGSDITSSLSINGPVGRYGSIILFSTSTADPSVKTPNSGGLIITLAADGTTSGHLHLAAFNGNPAVDADMAGTWTQTGNTVQFQQAADTFVRNMTFTIEPISDSVWFLVGDDVYAGTRFNVRLAQSSMAD